MNRMQSASKGKRDLVLFAAEKTSELPKVGEPVSVLKPNGGICIGIRRTSQSSAKAKFSKSDVPPV